MSNAESPRFYDLFRKVASLEKRLNRLEDGYQQLDNVVDPQGWIGEAFKLQEEERERKDNYVPEVSALAVSTLDLDQDTKKLLIALNFEGLAGSQETVEAGKQ
jgi:hypothetical protein